MKIVLCVLLLVLPCLLAVSAEPLSQNASDTPPDSLVRKLDDGRFRIGDVILDVHTQTISVPGRVNQQKGLVEYFAVTPQGKTHESVLVLDIQPLHLQTALLLLGLDYGQNLQFQGDTTLPRGDSVQISVRWQGEGGDSVTFLASDLLYDYHRQASIPPTVWVFTGSMIWQEQLLADVEGSIIATFSDPSAILNNPDSNRSDDTMYGANESVVPAKGTPITLLISPVTSPSESP